MWYRHISINSLIKSLRKPGFWLILVLLVLITIPQYEEALKHPAFLTEIIANLGLGRHSFERILYLAPIIWAALLFGQKGAIITSLVALACMLPYAIFISPTLDAVLESSAVFIIGNTLAVTFNALRKERDNRIQLVLAQQELRASEERYRELFENAHDAIWLHDLQEKIIAANRAFYRLTGYNSEELRNIQSGELIAASHIEGIREIENRLLNDMSTGQLSEGSMIRKDGSEMPVQLSTNPILVKGQIAGFQHIARDITEQKRMHENLHFHLQQITRAQEEERKRISRELHDDTVQALVVLSRRLDALASGSKELSNESSLLLEDLRQQTNNVIQGVRRLSQDLRPAALDWLGLLPALEWLTFDVAGYSGIPINIKMLGKERRLPEEVELVLFRIIQEALRNVWRHSEATQADVMVEFKEKKIRVNVRDNGKGFNPPETIGDLARDGKLGLAGMLERVQLLGGTLSVQSKPGKGSRVNVEISV
ncbi:PAS domain S-box protein [Chloroflexota bacterium]